MVFFGSKFTFFMVQDCRLFETLFFHNFIPAGIADESEFLTMDHWTLRYDQSYDHPGFILNYH